MSNPQFWPILKARNFLKRILNLQNGSDFENCNFDQFLKSWESILGKIGVQISTKFVCYLKLQQSKCQILQTGRILTFWKVQFHNFLKVKISQNLDKKFLATLHEIMRFCQKSLKIWKLWWLNDVCSAIPNWMFW